MEFKLGNRINSGIKNISGLLNKYCGVNICKLDLSYTDKIMLLIKESIINNIPIGINLDTYNCSWIPGRYRRFHDQHVCLVIGIDEKNIYCIDPALNLDVSRLSYFDFMEGCLGCFVYEFKENIKSYNILDLFMKSIYELNNSQTFNNIETFSVEFKNHFDFDLEYEKFEIDPWYVLIDRNLRFIAAGRTLCASFLQLVLEKQNISEILSIKNDLFRASSKWNTIRGFLTKSYYTSFNENIKDKVYDRIVDVINFEVNIFRNLCSIKANNEVYMNDNDKNNSKEDHISSSIEIIKLDLDLFFNNKAFIKAESDIYRADISGTGLFLLYNDILSKKILTIGEMEFRLPKFGDVEFDNISCSGQEIYINEGIYNKIMIMGCSDNGDFIDDLTIRYINEEISRISLAFSDSWRLPKFGETIAWVGVGGKWANNEFTTHTNLQRIFAIEQTINRQELIQAITLPECPNIHIFSISLCQEGEYQDLSEIVL